MASVSFEALIQKVRQAETALEARERQVGADWRQVKASWRAAWTPGRIVVAGLVSGFVVGRSEPLRRVGGGGTLQLLTALSGLFAGGSAQAAASEAEQAAKKAEQTATAVAPDAVSMPSRTAAVPPAAEVDPESLDALRRAGLL